MVLLSFDIEEFDMPFEYGRNISFADQISISVQGTHSILDILSRHDVKATFFSTATFASYAPGVITRIINEGHELASHGYYHSSFDVAHLEQSREKLESLSGQPVYGFRMPRMRPVDTMALEKAGYRYNSSVNPTWLPGRYNNLHLPRTYYRQGNIWEIPASVSPLLRFPLFWLSFHNLPVWMYHSLAKRAVRKDGYLNIYFHPWEFTDLGNSGLPGYVKRNAGVAMVNRMHALIGRLKGDGFRFVRFGEFVGGLPH
jgi:peptidoglycan/xylan/chitin deacetylase (PgdA/CDA1 family)